MLLETRKTLIDIFENPDLKKIFGQFFFQIKNRTIEKLILCLAQEKYLIFKNPFLTFKRPLGEKEFQ